jgi:tetratricopeptide (TPR) repeat protein
MALASALVISGCATVGQPPAGLPEDVAATRTEREETAVRDLERTRDSALYEAALAQWRDGDAAACESMLVRLLQRNDEHRKARLMLADLYASTGKPKAAERHLRLLTEQDASDAQAHHSLGMLLLETAGKADEAIEHLKKAAELEPDNELYSLSYAAGQADLHVPATGEPNSRQVQTEQRPRCSEAGGRKQPPHSQPPSPDGGVAKPRSGDRGYG